MTGVDDQASQTFTNTTRSLRIITRCENKDKYKSWLADKLAQACDTTNYENASAALGEIRALGSLLYGFREVDVIQESKEKTTDFVIVVDGTEIYIEVTTKQMNKEEAKALEKFNHEPPPEKTEPVFSREHVISPAGKAKKMEDGKYETTAENVASKIANLKAGSKQVREGSICVLWIDMQDEDWWGTSGDNAFPITSWNGALTTVGIWYSFYGKKGTPLFDNYCPFYGPGIHVQTMRFNGKFFQNDNRFCGAALNFGRSLVFYDDPNAKHPIPDRFWFSAVELPWFNYERSIIRWPAGLGVLEKQIEMQRNILDAFGKIKPFS